MNRRVLMVDDDERVLRAYHRSMHAQFELDVALGAVPAIQAVVEHGPYAVIVADMQMPGMNGVDLLKRVAELNPETVRIMLTGNADQATAVDAVNQGQIFRFLNKPCAVPELSRALEAGLEQHRLITAEQELLEKTLSGAIDVLTELLSLADPAGFGRAQEVAEFSTTLGKMLGAADAWSLRISALLAQVGRMAVPMQVLEKAKASSQLTVEERAILQRVPEMGAKLLAHVPRLEEVAKAIRYQDKGYDGKGLPFDEIKGEAIPLASRIIGCVAAFVEMEARRKNPRVVLEELKLAKGRFDPKVIDALELLVLPAAGNDAPSQPKAVSLQDLMPGMVLVEDAVTLDGMLLFAQGARLGPSHLEKLQNFAELRGVKEPLLVLYPARP